MISSKGTWASWFSAHCLHFIFALLGSMTILPTVLFLVTGVLKETAVKTPDNSVPVPVAAALQSIKTIFTSPIARMESVQTQWTSLVRSSLASVLEYSQPGELIHTHSLSDSDFLSFCGAEICLALPVYKKKSTTSLLIKSMFVCVFFFRWVQAWHGWGQYADSDHTLPAVSQQWACRSDCPAEGLHGPLPKCPQL